MSELKFYIESQGQKISVIPCKDKSIELEFSFENNKEEEVASFNFILNKNEAIHLSEFLKIAVDKL